MQDYYRPCKDNTCPECAPRLHQGTNEREQTVRMVTLQEQYLEHGYLELVEDDSALFRDLSERVLSADTIAPIRENKL